MGMLDAIRRYPKIFARYFPSEERKSLTFGLELYCVYEILSLAYIYYISDCLRNLFEEGKFSD